MGMYFRKMREILECGTRPLHSNQGDGVVVEGESAEFFGFVVIDAESDMEARRRASYCPHKKREGIARRAQILRAAKSAALRMTT